MGRITPEEIIVAQYRTEYCNQMTNVVEWWTKLDLVNDKHWASEDTRGQMRLATTHYFNRQVNHYKNVAL